MIKLSLVEEKKKKKKVSGAYLTFTTGNPDYNCKMFNKRMGTDFEDQIKDATKDAEKEANAVETAVDAEAAAIDSGTGATVDVAGPGEAAAADAGDTGAGDGGAAGAGGEGGGAMGESLHEDTEVAIADAAEKWAIGYVIWDHGYYVFFADKNASGEEIGIKHGSGEFYPEKVYTGKTFGSARECVDEILNNKDKYASLTYPENADKVNGRINGALLAIKLNDTQDDAEKRVLIFDCKNHKLLLAKTLKGQLEEAVDYYTQVQKMRALENGTRGFNAAAASDEKLRVNRQVCIDYGLTKALAIVEAEMKARGMLNSDKMTIGYPVNKSYVQADDVTIVDISDVKNSDASEVCDKNKKDFRKLSLALIYALSLKDSTKAKAIKDYILDKFNIDEADLTAAIKLTISDDTIMNKITDINNRLTTESLKEETELTEAKREVRRYYIRPQNIYCANKAGIIKALIAIGDKGENCSVYSLKNLVDNEDVHKLTNNDIIYYYDEGVLYDKNHVRIMDYDLYVKKEEKRKHFTGTDMDLDREPVKQEYEDRLTVADLPEVEPDIYEAFDLDFAPVNAFGEILTEAKGGICCICGEEIDGYGNNPAPVKSEGRCCDACNMKFVIPARMAEYQGFEPDEETTEEE